MLFRPIVGFSALLLACALQGAMAGNVQPPKFALPLPDLDQKTLEQLSNQALDGSVRAAERLSSYYTIMPRGRDLSDATYWTLIAAENGSAVETYYAGVMLREWEVLNGRNQRRSLYWLHRLIKEGRDKDGSAQDYLERYYADEKLLPLSADLKPFGKLAEEALNGSGDAAREMATHYVLKGGKQDALYWALIAAQNGDTIGMYQAAVLLHGSHDPGNERRALFWLRRVVKQDGAMADLAKGKLNKWGQPVS